MLHAVLWYNGILEPLRICISDHIGLYKHVHFKWQSFLAQRCWIERGLRSWGFNFCIVVHLLRVQDFGTDKSWNFTRGSIIVWCDTSTGCAFRMMLVYHGFGEAFIRWGGETYFGCLVLVRVESVLLTEVERLREARADRCYILGLILS